MLPKGLAKVYNLIMSKTWVMDIGIWPTMTCELTWKSYKKSLVESLKSKRFQKCLKILFEGSLSERWNNKMKVDIEKCKDNCKVKDVTTEWRLT
jgi:hypothetical protein